MWMTEYINEIQRQFIEVYHYPENPDRPGCPVGVTDGEYPMMIEGKVDKVLIKDDKIYCCRFD
jgi:hypothetical protein